jgi:hypothetical protein
MKRIQIAGLVLALFAMACNSGGEGSENEDTTSSNITNVENVNGNLPETTNSINLNAGDTTSSTQDTIPR